MPLKTISLEKLNSELSCWIGDISAAKLGKRCIELEFFPWELKNFPIFLHAYLNTSRSILERSTKARYFWKDCPAEYKENYLFLYDLGINGKLTFNREPSCFWPNPAKSAGLTTQLKLLSLLNYE